MRDYFETLLGTEHGGSETSLGNVEGVGMFCLWCFRVDLFVIVVFPIQKEVFFWSRCAVFGLCEYICEFCFMFQAF